MNKIFSNGIPTSAQWTDIAKMSAVLEIVGSQPNSNHMYFPRSGGLDLAGSAPYKEEPGCLELKVGDHASEVVKPSALLFESFGTDLQWAYFRLECEPLQDSGAYTAPQGGSEEVVLLAPGKAYAPRSAWDNGEYEGKSLPISAHLITRSTGGGPLVIFSKGSSYNFSESDTYDGRHANLNAAEFRDYIQRSATSS
ncbi:hypothetical protein HDF16_006138 [Granulicella aggregans]|uniref:Uncharacterized protein n=1 Tax=Granulicella aggregans TaxID=474949 RepID=A0A7W7ZK81_9BACT|nr:hypothetical protein [Granulicella aggregans]MBB5061402.1 hypothetical protein [Granulicella aggregans]